jgi:hypothetical protein
MYIVTGDMWQSRLILTSAMRFEYHLRFLHFKSLITTRKTMNRYEGNKISTDKAKRMLIGTIGAEYRGERYFVLVDRVVVRLPAGLMPVYDVQLSLSDGLTLNQLLDLYEDLRMGGIRRGWYVLFWFIFIRLTLRKQVRLPFRWCARDGGQVGRHR